MDTSIFKLPASRTSAPGKAGPKVDLKKNHFKLNLKDNFKRNKRKFYYAGGGALVLLLLLAWFAWPSSRLAAVRQLRDEAFKAAPNERREKFEALKAAEAGLSPTDRKALWRDMGKKRDVEAAKYFAMSPAERKKVIDEQLAREKKWEEKRAKDQQAGGGPGAGGPGGGGPGGGGPGGGGRGGGGRGGRGGGGPGGPGGGPGGPGGGPGGWRGPASPEERDNMRREMLIHSTPQARAGMDQQRLDMAVARVNAGLPAQPTGRGPGGGPGGGGPGRGPR
jgi:hypothetical protein